jgi:ankyrin repeat protein
MHERTLQKNVLAKRPLPKADIAKSEKPSLSKKEQKILNSELLDAAVEGETQKIQRLLKKGANIEATDSDGWTALMLATYNEHAPTCALLLEKGANIEAKDNIGRTALMIAARFGKTETAEFLRPYPIRKMLGEKGAMRFISVFNKCVGK